MMAEGATERAKVTTQNLNGKVLAFRGWEIGFDGQSFSLVSHYREGLTRWTPNQPLEAKCLRRTDEPHESPHANCQCGLYAAKEPTDSIGSITGTVEMWGRYVEHERGWRAEYAYPVALAACRCETCNGTISLFMAKIAVVPTTGFVPRLSISCRDCLPSQQDGRQWIPSSHAMEQLEFSYGLEVD